ncbi:P-loop NTPase fold protein [Streptomyces xinghaiensis]
MSAEAGWSDEPIDNTDADSLQRKNLAKETAQLIERVTASPASKVFALTGPWGSGKTSLALMIEGRLKKCCRGWKTAHFTPWAAADTESMTAEFIAALTDILPDDRRAKALELLGQAISMGSSGLSVALPAMTGVPAGRVAQGGKKVQDWLTKPKPWQKVFDELSSELDRSKGRALILVDDIDRLDQEQLAVLLKIIRLLGRFPNIHYLLMYDERTLFETLSGDRNDKSAALYANRYMEKIVQYQVPVPPMSRYQIERRVQQGLDDIAARRGRMWDWRDSTYRDARDILVAALKTPRGIDRYVVQFDRLLALHSPEEIDDIDLMLLTVLQTQDPVVYGRLPDVKGYLTFDNRKHFRLPLDEEEDIDWQTVVGATDPWEGSLTKEIVNTLFPATLKKTPTDSIANSNSICHGEYFDRYFVHVIHGEDVPDRLLDDALKQLQEKSEQSSLVTLFREKLSKDQMGVALGRLIQRTVPKTLDQESQSPLGRVEAVARLHGSLPERRDGAMTAYSRVQDWLVQLLEHVDTTISATDLVGVLRHVGDPFALAEVLGHALRNSQNENARIDPHQTERVTLLKDVGALCTDELVNAWFNLISQQEASSERDPRLTRMGLMLSVIGDSEGFLRCLSKETEKVTSREEVVACYIAVEKWYPRSDNSSSVRGLDKDALHALWPNLPVDFNAAEQSSLEPYDVSWGNIVRFAQACIV